MNLNIGSSTYDLHVVRQAELDDSIKDLESDITALGITDFVKDEIRISSGTSLQGAKQTFCHELVHAMLDEIGEAELTQDERFVEAFSKQLYGFVIRNNFEKIFKHITDKHERQNRSNN